jgi:hypothetical protein
MTDQIKAYANIIFAVIGLAGLGFSHFKAFEYGEAHIQSKFDTYRGEQHDLIQKAENEKAKLDKEKDDRAAMSQAGFVGALDILNGKLQNAEAVSWRGCVPVASGSGTSETVPEAATYTLGTTIRLAATNGICSQDFYNKAMREHLQCQRLIDLVR